LALVTTTWRLQVADGEDGLQMWRVAMNILNKQPTVGDSSVWWVGGRLIAPYPTRYKMLQRASDLDGFFGTTESSEKGRMGMKGLDSCVSG
jgi:hypothetical protein